ncbi:MAG: putative selenoprotein [Acidobacteria bacterium]|nr:putative selenoprotein [Acidobacteriota bacterium]
MSRIRKTGNLLWALLRELADQSAYERYLKERRTRPSPEEWRRFSDARAAARFGQPRCC